jgi:peptide/nickel transport system substrate-binding protein
MGRYTLPEVYACMFVALLLVVLVIPDSTPAATATPTPPPTSTIERLKFATTAPWIEVVLSWRGGSFATNLIVRNFAEPLVDTDHRTGTLVPGLATSWEMTTPDAKTWTFKLRKGVPFHFGWGELTAKDVVHTISQIVAEGIATDSGFFRTLFGRTEEEVRRSVQTPDDYTLVFKLLRPEPNLDFVLSAQAGNLLIHSKAQWDKEGLVGTQKRPAGTGPWQLVEQQLGQWLLFQRVQNHWRKIPEFKEFQILFAPEDATRLAMLLSGEVHIAEVSRELHKGLIAKGMKVWNSQLPGTQAAFLLAGNYRPDSPPYDPTVPLVRTKVREAINRAINRKELRERIFQGIGEPLFVWAYHPKLPGWNPGWEQKFDEKYGYDPLRAKQLLEEAGYPQGFTTKIVIAPFPGFPETTALGEALFNWLRAIGIQAEIEEIEFIRLRELARGKKAHNIIWPMRTSFTPPLTILGFYNISGPTGRLFTYEDERIDEKYAQILNSPDKAERERLLREIGDIKFNDYAEAPLLWLPGQVVVNPKIVAEYIFPGNVDAVFTHFEYVKAAR